MKIVYHGRERIVTDAVDGSNSILLNPHFYDSIRLRTSFDHCNATPSQIADFIYYSNLIFSINLYTSRRNSRVLGYVTASSPNTLFLNTRKLNRRVESIAATIIHESVHAVDHSIPNYFFGHKGNRPGGNQNTAPYWIGKLAGELLTGKSPVVASMNANNLIMDIDIEEDVLDPNPILMA